MSYRISARPLVELACKSLLLFLACLLAHTCLVRPAAGQTADSAQPAANPPAFWGLEFSPDGKWLAAATRTRGQGGPIVLWRVEDWRPQVVRMEPTGGLHVAFSPDGTLLAYSTRSPRVHLLEVPSGKLVRTIEALPGRQGLVYGVAFSPDGRSLLTAGADHKIHVWNVADGSHVRAIEGHTDTVCVVALSPDGALLLSGGEDCTCRLWDMASGDELWEFRTFGSIVRRVGFSRDGRYFFTSSYDGKTRLRDTKTRELRFAAPGGSDCAAMTRDNRLLVTTGYGTTFNAYRVDFGPPSPQQQQRVLALIRQLDDDDYDIREAAFNEILEIGAVADPLLKEALDDPSPEVRMRAKLLRRQTMSPKPTAELTGHRGDSEVLCFSPDDKLLATGCRGGDLKIWSVPDFKELVSLTAPVE